MKQKYWWEKYYKAASRKKPRLALIKSNTPGKCGGCGIILEFLNDKEIVIINDIEYCNECAERKINHNEI